MQRLKRKLTVQGIILVIGIVMLFLMPVSIVFALDTTPPEISYIDYGPRVGVRTDPNLYIWIDATIMDDIGIANATLTLTGPPGFPTQNVTMTFGGPYDYYYEMTSVPLTGIYHFYVRGIDTSGNVATSPTHMFIIIENFLNYAQIDDSNTIGPWDGSAVHPFQFINDGLQAISAGGTVFIHNGFYRETLFIGQVNLIGESKENVIIDGSGPGYEQVMKYQSVNHTSLSNVTIQNGSYYGIYLENVNNITITNCILRNNQQGIFLVMSTYNVITNCNIQNNNIGIFFWSGDPNSLNKKNQLYHNNFKNNTAHISGYPGVNIWDNGESGNYWDTYRTTHSAAHVVPSTGTWDTPYTIYTNNIDRHPWVYPNGYIGSPPQAPGVPAGPLNGIARVEYTYTAIATDSDSAQLYYWFDWGDRANSGWIGPYTSGAQGFASHRWNFGGYQIKAKAKDADGQESRWSQPLQILMTNQSLQENLVIHAPSSVIEGREFQITVTTTSGIPATNAQVTFSGEKKYTNDYGITTFTAPDVNKNTEFSLTVSQNGFSSTSVNIIVLSQLLNEQGGWIYGVIYDDSTKAPLSAVGVSAFYSNEENKGTFTDDVGRYVLLLPAGYYTLQITKKGYISSTTNNVLVTTNSAFEHNIFLQKDQEQSTSSADTDTGIIEYTIQEKTSQGAIGGRITLDSNKKTISYYSDALTLHLNSTDSLISLNVSGEEGSLGTILVIHIGDGVLSDLDNLLVTYDGEPLPEMSDVAGFFTIQQTSNASWLRFLTTTGLYIFVRIPHFSSHTITISSLGRTITKALSSTTAAVFFLSATTGALLLFIVPIYLLYFRKPKR